MVKKFCSKLAKFAFKVCHLQLHYDSNDGVESVLIHNVIDCLVASEAIFFSQSNSAVDVQIVAVSAFHERRVALDRCHA